jgi:hypothetical protein
VRVGDPASQYERALDHPATRDGLNRLLRAAGLQAVVGVGFYSLFALTNWLVGDPNAAPGSWFLGLFGGLSFLGVLFAVLTAVNNARMRLILRRYPWRARPAKFGEVDVGPVNGQPVLVFADTDSPDGTRSVVTLATRWGILGGHDSVWYAGRDDRSGVASPPGGGEPMWARRMVIRWLRRFFGGSVSNRRHLRD